MKAFCQRTLDSSWFNPFIISVIVLAGVVVGIETFPELVEQYGGIIGVANTVILWIFVAEVVVKMSARFPNPLLYFKDPWNCFDFIIVAVCFLPVGDQSVAVLRLFRLLRVLRLITAIPRLQVLVSALLRSLPSMFYVTILLFLLFYVYAVFGVILFSKNDPVHFGNLWTSMLSLFRVVTLEDWTDIMYIQMLGSDVYQSYHQDVTGMVIVPRAMPFVGALYFVSFVLMGTMIMLNLIIGVIISGMDEAQKEVADRRLHELLTEGKPGADSAELVRAHRVGILVRQLKEIGEEIERLK